MVCYLWVCFYSVANVVTPRNIRHLPMPSCLFLAHTGKHPKSNPLRPFFAILQNFPLHVLTTKIVKTQEETSLRYFSYRHIR